MDYENDDELVEVALDKPILVDFDGNDSLAMSDDELKAKVVHFASAALPALLQQAMNIALHSKSEKNKLEAIKIVKSFTDMQYTAKAIEGTARRMTDAEIAAELEKSS